MGKVAVVVVFFLVLLLTLPCSHFPPKRTGRGFEEGWRALYSEQTLTRNFRCVFCNGFHSHSLPPLLIKYLVVSRRCGGGGADAGVS